MRRFFHDRDFLEVDTPITLQQFIPEPYLDPFTLATDHSFRHLQTSPELAMKCLLDSEHPRLYQLAAVFRQDPIGPEHHPEFRMLEWYRYGESYQRIQNDVFELYQALRRAAGQKQAAGYRRITVEEAFEDHTQISILQCIEEPARLEKALDRFQIPYAPNENWSDLFHRLYLNRVEPALLQDPSPLFLIEYPSPLSALARIDPSNPKVALRFEFFCNGLEIANGYDELCDPEQQQQRITLENQQRIAQGLQPSQPPPLFFEQLECTPQASGVAVGWERLLMAVLDQNDIRSVLPLDWECI